MPQDIVRVLQITDPHLFAEADNNLRGTVTADTLNAVVDHVLEQRWPADFVVLTGDLVQDDSAGAYNQFKTIMGRLGMPIYCLPGNHDVRPLMKAALSVEPWHYCETFVTDDWLFVCIDSCADDEAGGVVSDDELFRLGAELTNAPAPHAIVFLHHPPLKVGSKWLDSVGLRNADEFLEVMMAPGNVRAAVFGHVHQAFDMIHDGVRIIGTPSSCAQFKPFEDEFSLDNKPPAYRRISLHSSGTIDTELIWLEMDE